MGPGGILGDGHRGMEVFAGERKHRNLGSMVKRRKALLKAVKRMEMGSGSSHGELYRRK